MTAKFIKDKVVRGKRQLTVELSNQNDTVLVISPDEFYQLGGQMDDIVPGHVLTEAAEVRWDHHSQEWEVV